MDIKKWAGTKLGMGGPPGAGGAPPGAAPAPGGFPPAAGAQVGMYGPPSTPLFNPEISSASLPPTMAQWAQAGGTSPQHPMGPPPWASDQGAFAHASALVQKDWAAYKEPWAVVAMLYDAMAGGAPPAAGAPPGGPPKPPPFGAPPGGSPKPPGAAPGAKPPGFPPKGGP